MHWLAKYIKAQLKYLLHPVAQLGDGDYMQWQRYNIKGAVSPCNKLFLNSAHLLDSNFCANNNCSKVFILKKFKIHVRRHFPGIDMGWRPLARVCLWLHVSSCLHSTRRRYLVSINMASIKA